MSAERICSGPGCDRLVYAKDLCKTHGAQARLGKALTPIRRVVRRGAGARCTLDGCDRPHSAQGLCGTHYDQQRKGRQMRTPRAKAPAGEYPKGCTYPGCDVRAHVRGLCVKHYGRGVSQYVRDALLAAQDGHCLCGSTDPSPHPTWHLDHDHTCALHGQDSYCLQCLRGMLCRDCNVKALSWYEAKRAVGMPPVEPLEMWIHRRIMVTGDPWTMGVQVQVGDVRLAHEFLDHEGDTQS